MNPNKFLNIDIEPAPAELELSVELRCRQIQKSKDIKNLRNYCVHLIRHQMKQDVFLASILGRLVELESQAIVKDIQKEKTNKNFINRLKNFFHIP